MTKNVVTDGGLPFVGASTSQVRLPVTTKWLYQLPTIRITPTSVKPGLFRSPLTACRTSCVVSLTQDC
jgi:hypothetical protein